MDPLTADSTHGRGDPIYEHVDPAVKGFAVGIDAWNGEKINWPRLACGVCAVGYVVFGTVARFTDRDSRVEEHNPVESGTYTINGRCENGGCEQDFHAAGSYQSVPYDYNDEFGQHQRDYSTRYLPACVYPPPRLMALPASTPRGVKKSVEYAASALFSTPPLAIVALRSAIEALLDAKGVPESKNLHQRIEKLPKYSEESKQDEMKTNRDLLRSAKEAGNAGAHQTGTTVLDDVLEMAEIIGEVLHRLYADPRPTIEERAQRLEEKFKPKKRSK